MEKEWEIKSINTDDSYDYDLLKTQLGDKCYNELFNYDNFESKCNSSFIRRNDSSYEYSISNSDNYQNNNNNMAKSCDEIENTSDWNAIGDICDNNHSDNDNDYGYSDHYNPEVSGVSSEFSHSESVFLNKNEEFIGSTNSCFAHRNLQRSDIINQLLFDNSEHTVKDFCIAINHLRNQYPSKIGQTLLASIVGLMSTFLGRNNILKAYLGENPSYYRVNQLILESTTNKNDELRCLRFQNCNKCGIEQCRCNSIANIKNVIHYFPFADRIKKIFKSKVLYELLGYPDLRPKKNGVIQDVYDGSLWRNFQQKLNKEEKLIALELSWDGAKLFNRSESSNSFWPVMVSILNFPPVLRDKLHYGMHLLAIGKKEDDIVFEIVVQEFQRLWRDGIDFEGTKYRIAIIRFIMDGPAFEKFTCTQGSKSLVGCNVCKFPGQNFASAIVYPGYRRYLPLDDPRRDLNKTHRYIQQSSNEYHFIAQELRPPPEMRTYEEYIANSNIYESAKKSNKKKKKKKH